MINFFCKSDGQAVRPWWCWQRRCISREVVFLGPEEAMQSHAMCPTKGRPRASRLEPIEGPEKGSGRYSIIAHRACHFVTLTEQARHH